MKDKKIIRLKNADERKIINEHEGLYDRLVSENFAKQPARNPAGDGARTKKKALIWSLSAVSAAVIVFAAVIASSFLFIGHNGNKVNEYAGNDAAENGAAIPSEDYSVLPGAQDNIIVQRTDVDVDTVTNSLKTSTLMNDGLNFRNVSEVTVNGEREYFELNVETYHTFDVIVSVDDKLEKELNYGELAEETINAHGYKVLYSINKKAMGDLYEFNTKAVVYAGEETYYIIYNYVSSDGRCELLDMIEFYITPKPKE